MPSNGVDPARLAGDALIEWYRRRPEDIERERISAAKRRFESFFGRSSASAEESLKLPSERFRPIENRPSPTLAFRNGQAGARPSLFQERDQEPNGLGPNPILNWFGRGQPKGGGFTELADPSQDCKTAATPLEVFSKELFGFRPESERPSSKTPPGPDPARTEVFKRGTDGKLHPVAGWHTTGPFDFSAWSHNIDGQGVADDLAKISAGAIAFLEGGNWAGEIVGGLGFNIGPDVVSGIINGHHSFPRFMGGPQKQNLSYVYSSLHRMFHSDLAAAFKQAGFPRIGGKGGSTQNWREYFVQNPEKWDEAVAILKNATREFDRKNGTTITKYLDDTISRVQPPTKRPPQ